MKFLALILCATAAVAAPRPIALRCGALIDGKSAAPSRNVVVLVRGERIEQAGPNVAIPADAEVVDLRSEERRVGKECRL